jgi:hypothetical protein
MPAIAARALLFFSAAASCVLWLPHRWPSSGIQRLRATIQNAPAFRVHGAQLVIISKTFVAVAPLTAITILSILSVAPVILQ